MKYKELKKSQRLALLYQILEENFGMELDEWSNNDLKDLNEITKEIIKLRERG